MLVYAGFFDIPVHINHTSRESVFSRIILSKSEIIISPQKKMFVGCFFVTFFNE